MRARLLQIAYSGLGGTGEVAVELARSLDRARFSPLVCFFGREPVADDYARRLDDAGVPWWHVPLRNRPASLSALARSVCGARAQLLVAHGGVNALVLPVLRVAQPAARAVAVYHGPPALLQSARGRALWLPGAAAAHRVVCVAPHLRALAASRLPARSEVILNGVLVGDPLPSATEPLVAMTATLSPSKDHATLLRAIALLRAGGSCARLALAGDGRARPAIEQLAARLRTSSHVEFLGSVSREQAGALLARTRVFAYATHGEGCPMAVLEAMAAGRPVVASRVPGVTDILEHETNGLLVDPGSPEALAQAISRLLSCSDEAQRLGSAGRETVIARYSLPAFVRAWENLADSLLSTPCPTVPSAFCTSRR